MLLLFFALLTKTETIYQIADDDDPIKYFSQLYINITNGGQYMFGPRLHFEHTNHMVFGKPGSGKSSLINYILGGYYAETGFGFSTTKEIKEYTREGIPISLFDVPGFESNVEEQTKLYKQMLKVIKKQKTANATTFIHSFLYCISSLDSHVSNFEIDFLKKLIHESHLGNIPFIIVVTNCCNKQKQNRMIEYIKQLNLNASAIVPVLSEAEKTDSGIVKRHGLSELLKAIGNSLPSILKETSNNLLEYEKYSRLFTKAAVITTTGINTGIGIYTHCYYIFFTNLLMLFSINQIYGVNVSTDFMINYIKWQLGNDENKEFFDSNSKYYPNDEYSLNDDKFTIDDTTKDKIMKVYWSTFAISLIKDGPSKIMSELDTFKENVKELLELAANGIIWLVKWLIKNNQYVKGFAAGTSTYVLGENYRKNIEDIFLNIHRNITCNDIKNYIEQKYSKRFD